MRQLLVVVLACLLSGCTRAYYRNSADKETYSATDERDHDPRWDLPRISIDPSPLSRFYDPYNPNRPPMPPDDPAADRYMQVANGMKGYKKWHKNGDAPWIEDPFWIETLPWSAKHELELTPERSVELALIHSRDYQFQLESLYFVALGLTLNRFEFAVHWFLTNNTQYVHFGSGGFPTESNQLQTNSTFGFTQAFRAGGQLGVDLLNSFAFEFAGPYQQVVTSNIVIDFLQPILRHAGRDVRMETLTQGERSLLYQVRTFARYRKQFTVGIYTLSYLGLLGQLQTIRNQEANLAQSEQNYRLQEALFAAGVVTTVEVDQAFVQMQQSKSQLLQQKTNYQNTLDQFKIDIGLPPKIPVTIDDAQLKPFQLSDPGLDAQQNELEQFVAEFRELEKTPALAKLKDGFDRLKKEHRRTEEYFDQAGKELKTWQAKLDRSSSNQGLGDRSRARARALAQQMPEFGTELVQFRRTIDQAAAGLAENNREQDWATLQKLIRQEIDLSGQVFVMQNQIRAYLIELEPIEFTEATAVEYALANRLDYMNQRGQVIDAWRQIQVTANALEAGLDIHVNANIATDPLGKNPVDFAASASTYTVGLAFDGPLNRQAERNAYRTSQINYERARRSFMLLDDTIQQTIRRLLRQLETDRLNFEINREALIAAARNVDAARGQLLIIANAQSTAASLNVLNALSGLLSAKNAVISNWISYETNRIQLLLATEALQLDARGLYLNERNASNRDSPADQLPAPRQLPAAGATGPSLDQGKPGKDGP